MRLDRKKLVCAMIDANMNTTQLAEKAALKTESLAIMILRTNWPRLWELMLWN